MPGIFENRLNVVPGLVINAWDLAVARKLIEIANECRAKAQEIDQPEAELSVASAWGDVGEH